jgi:hypothetical protein
MPVCPKCKEDKPSDEFRTKGYRRPCKKCLSAYSLEWRRRNPGRRHKPIYTHRHNLKKNYHMTVAQFDVMLAEQESLCRICGKHIHLGGKRLHIDHIERDGKIIIRGLLCPECNKGLGLFYDKPDVLRAAALYLEGSNG